MEKISLTDSELKIIKVMWQDAPVTLRRLENELSEETGWTRHTLISFLKRMQIKHTVRAEEAKPHKLYYPLVTEAQVQQYQVMDLLEKLFDGSPTALLRTVMDCGDLPQQEVDSLLMLVAQARGEQ